ncbi:enolase C-terminal domain-like protein [Nocardia sp. NPDC049220]|uniref:enolase C-terminal domain-like protein n=1 Tax=Nocardia sp. NPDC049220 TaxID=3155273 RepID=UPI0033F7E379
MQPDAPGIGGFTQFLKFAGLAEHNHLQFAPHFAMEVHLHLATAYPLDAWVDHFDWLDPPFNEHLEIRDGRMHLSNRPGLGFTATKPAPGPWPPLNPQLAAQCHAHPAADHSGGRSDRMVAATARRPVVDM